MRAFCSLARRILRLSALAAFFASAYSLAVAQAADRSHSGRISGTVADPTGAVIPQAVVTAARAGHAPITTKSDGMGRYAFTGLAPGVYVLEASEPGFKTARREGVRVAADASLTLTITLAIASDQQSVVVNANAPDSSPEKNGGAIVLKGDDLDALSDDPDELQSQLQAIAGADTETGTQFYVDGFTAGKLPPKSEIREIRINQNPYSAQYEEIGYGRIEILTKPGTDKLHGDYWMQGNNSPWNALNPFVTSQPPYYSWELATDVDGPISKNASYFVTLWTQKAISDSIVNAEILDSALNSTAFTQAVSTPSDNLYFTPRIDWQWGKVHTLSVRYELDRNTASNSGVGQFALASQAINTSNMEQVLQISDSQAWSVHVLNDLHFQYIRDRNNQTPLSTGTTLAVQGAFTGGGNNTGINRDAQDHYELQDILRIDHGPHDLNMGGRLRVLRDANYSTGGYNGSYTFASLAAYQVTMQGIQNGWTPAQISAAGGGASLFTQTMGTPSVIVAMADAGIFAEDNWKLNPNVTFSYGLRFESQTGIHDHADYAPRIGFGWTIPGGKTAPKGKADKAKPKPPIGIVRGGFGIFYMRFPSSALLQAERQNGVTQTAVVVNDPDFFPGTCTTDPSDCAQSAASATAPTIYSISPSMRASYLMMGGLGMDKSIGTHVSLSANYMYSRGDHQFLTRNINAPLPGTYIVGDPTSGVRPLGINENIYQYGSEGASERNRFTFNGSYQIKGGGLWGFYMLSKADANTGGLTSFPSNQYDLNVDWGRASWDIRNRVFFGGFFHLLNGFSVNPFFIYQSSSPFNITVGQDLNGDTQFNDRPAFATDLSRSSVYYTKWGVFDADPIAGQKIIPINYGKGPGLVVFNLRMNRSFNFGPKLPDNPPAGTSAATPVIGTQSTASKAPAKAKKKPPVQRKYTLGFGVQAQNLFNHPNYAPPVGVLGSAYFGESTAMASSFNASPDRSINFETFFRF